MLKETVSCGDVWQSCHTQHEVRTMKDQHIGARMTQFKANRGGGGSDVDITKCDVIKEYIDSGRADQVHQTTEGSCTNSEASGTLRNRLLNHQLLLPSQILTTTLLFFKIQN